MKTQSTENNKTRNFIIMAALALPVLFFQAFSPSDQIDADDEALQDLISGTTAHKMKLVEKEKNNENLKVATERLEGYLAYDLDAAERNSRKELRMIASILQGNDKSSDGNGEVKISQLEIK